jgi:hypothetical protein
MTAASTIAPARSAVPAAPKRLSPESTVIGGPIVEPQHMRALARANEVRLARAQMKREIASGHRSVLDVVRECPWEAESMTVGELLRSQRRWGRARSRKLINSVGLTENKQLGSFTQRQRDLLVAALAAKDRL